MKSKINLENAYFKFIEDSINKLELLNEYQENDSYIKKNSEFNKDNKYRILNKTEKQIIFEIAQNNLELREELIKIMYLIKKMKFITPDMLNTIYSPNRSAEENNYNLLQLASIFGGPLNKKTYSVLGSKYVYTNKKYKFNEDILNYYNKASYILCKIHSSNKNIKVIDVNTELKCKNNNIYAIIKVALSCNKDIRYIYIIPSIDSYTYFKSNYNGIFLNTERVGEILKKIDIVNEILINYDIEKIKGLSDTALLTYNI